MSDHSLIQSKTVRDGFTATLHYDLYLDESNNPRFDRDNLASIYLWDDIKFVSDSEEVTSYHTALQHIYQDIYPELTDYLDEDEPPQEVLDLVEATEYPGTLKWIRVRDNHEVSITTTDSPDEDDRYLAGVAFIPDHQLQKENLTREEGAVVIENDLVMLQEFINGNMFRLRVTMDDETFSYDGIYALENYETVGKLQLHRSSHTPEEDELDGILMDFVQDERDRDLIKSTSWV